jgi:hypothetical protein
MVHAGVMYHRQSNSDGSSKDLPLYFTPLYLSTYQSGSNVRYASDSVDDPDRIHTGKKPRKGMNDALTRADPEGDSMDFEVQSFRSTTKLCPGL